MKTINFTILSPGGNDTAICAGNVKSFKTREKINNLIMDKYPDVEQVGFIAGGLENPKLSMAGGEFCANALRCAALLLVGSNLGKIKIKVPGIRKKLTAGVQKSGEVSAQMPVYSNSSNITRIKENYLIKMKGIVFYLDFNSKIFTKISEEKMKEKALSLIEKNGLDDYPAAGIIYARQNQSGWEILPVVYVRKIKTLFLETACGSGSTALGMVLSFIGKNSVINIPVFQPSKQIINVTVIFNGKRFNYAEIKGRVKILLQDKINY